jgi:Phloem protein 2
LEKDSLLNTCIRVICGLEFDFLLLTRYPEALELKYVYWLEIKATTNFNKLPVPNTQYGVYLIFKTSNSWKGLDTVLHASVTDTMDAHCQPIMSYVCLKPKKGQQNIGLPEKSGDGWMELELGRFYCDDNTRDREVDVTLFDPNRNNNKKVNEKKGLIIAGIEFRPLKQPDTNS